MSDLKPGEINNTAYVDDLEGYHDVPSVNSAENTKMRDVIGNKTDDHTANSIRALLHTLDEHIHKAANVYPTAAAGETVTCGDAAAWDLGSFKEIVPASTIGSDFDIHWIELEAVSAAAVYELVLYATTTEIGRVRFSVLGTPNNLKLNAIPIQTPIIDADTQIQAKLMSSTGALDTATISIGYHIY